jgi:succinate-acetate transporter protein
MLVGTQKTTTALAVAWSGGPAMRNGTPDDRLPFTVYPATAGGVPLSAFAFAFAVGFLGLVETGILSSAANDIFLATCFGIGAVGLLVGGMWEFRGGEVFGGTGVFAIAATSISWTAVAPFSLAFIVLVVLAISNLGGTASWTTDVAKVGGWVALLDSFAAGYLGAAIVLNVSMGKSLLPLFPAKSGAS